jgi:hypothetical protein
VGKALLALAIVGGVGWQFTAVLKNPALWQQPLHLTPAWLAASALLYLLGLGFFASFWYRLMRSLGEKPGGLAAARAYYIGHLGKYVPGKAWAVLLRTTLIRGAGVRTGVGALTASYETLTTMAAGALIAVVLFTLQASDDQAMGWKALGLLALAGIPILPGVFNRLVRGLTAPLREAGSVPLPRVRNGTLLGGLTLTACGWLVLGTSLWAMLRAVVPVPLPWSGEALIRCTAFLALAYVAGFLALPAPGGLGVRELILQQLLTPELRPLLGPELAGPLAVVTVLLLRLLWTVAEVIIAGVLYWLPPSSMKGPTPERITNDE